MPTSLHLPRAGSSLILGTAIRSLRTIRGRIWTASLGVAVITIALGGYAVVRIDEVGQLAEGRLVRAVEGALASSGLEPNCLELEITETMLLSDGSTTLDILHGLRRMGVRIAMDDFGTGYSSPSYLLSIPFDKIKIDQSFVRDLETRSEARTLVRTMVQLGRSLGIQVTADRVETERHLAQLCREGCDEIQGYLSSRPVPASEVEVLLSTPKTVQA